jgi:hypothetical protein
MRFHRTLLLVASIVASTPALAQEHEVGHWIGPASALPDRHSFQGGVRVAVGDVTGEGNAAPTAGAGVAAGALPTGHHNGFVSRFSAGGGPVDPDAYGRVKVQLPQLPSAPAHSAPKVRMTQPYAGAPPAGGMRAGAR